MDSTEDERAALARERDEAQRRLIYQRRQIGEARDLLDRAHRALLDTRDLVRGGPAWYGLQDRVDRLALAMRRFDDIGDSVVATTRRHLDSLEAGSNDLIG
jgi:hypothetical protein